MFLKIVFSFIAASVLSACMLQSPNPNFSEQMGKPLLGKHGGTYKPFTPDKDTWKADGEDMVFAAVGKHYEIRGKGKPTEALFIPVSNEWWLAQFRERGKETGYVFANVQPEAIYIYPLSCENLKINGTAQEIVTFKKDDCFLKAGTKLDDFRALISAAGQRVMKLVLKK
jgi:hypothetical protein